MKSPVTKNGLVWAIPMAFLAVLSWVFWPHYDAAVPHSHATEAPRVSNQPQAPAPDLVRHNQKQAPSVTWGGQKTTPSLVTSGKTDHLPHSPTTREVSTEAKDGSVQVVEAELHQPSPEELARDAAHARAIANHPYAKLLAKAAREEAEAREEGEAEKEKRGKRRDRPDLAVAWQYLRTMDPATMTVPQEKFIAAHEATQRMRRQYKSTNVTTTTVWTERGPNNVGGRTRAIMFDPNDATHKKVWAGGVGGGLWVTNDVTVAQPTWTAVNDFWSNIAISTMAYDPSNTQRFYVGTGEGWYNVDAIRGTGIFATTDGGTTWNLLASTNTSTFRHVQKVVVTSAGAIFAATRAGGIQRSTDNGATWAAVLANGVGGGTLNSAADLEIAANGDIYATLGIFEVGGVYKSVDNGNTWTKVTTGANGFPSTNINRIEIATAPNDANYLYAATQDATTYGVGGLYRSTDAGATWTSLTLPVDLDVNTIDPTDFTRTQAWYDWALAVSPTDKNTVVVGAVDAFITKNGGTSWTQISRWDTFFGPGLSVVHADHHAAVFYPGSSVKMLMGTDGGIFSTDDVTVTNPVFAERNNGYNVTQFYSAALHPTAGSNVMLAGAQDNGTQMFSQSGMGATVEATGGDGAFAHISQSNPNLMITAYTNNYLSISQNGGATFADLYASTLGDFINPTDFEDKNNFLFSNTYNSSTTTNQLDFHKNLTTTPTRSRFNLKTSLGSYITHIKASPYSYSGAAQVYLGLANSRVYRLTNFRENAASVPVEIVNMGTPLASSADVSCVEVGKSEDHIVVTYSNYGVTSVWETQDGGITWTNKEGNLPDMPVYWALFNPNDRNQVLLATETGIWATNDFSAASVVWAPIASFPNVRTDMLQYRASDETIMASTHGRGVFTSTFSILKPTANTLAPTSITLTSATLNGKVKAASSGSTNYHFEYGTSTSALTSTTSTQTAAAGTNNVSANITGLTSGTTYYYRLVTENGANTVKGEIMAINPSFPQTDLALWLRADEGVSTSGGDVTGWKDLANNGDVKVITSGTTLLAPTYNASVAAFNNKPTLSFNKSALRDYNVNFNTTNGITTFVVALPTTTTATADLISTGKVSEDFLMETNTTGKLITSYYRNGTTNTVTGTTTISTSTPSILSQRFGSNVQSFINGVSQGTAAIGALANMVKTIRIGSSLTTTAPFTGQIAEIIVFKKALSDADRLAVENYLSQKYGLGVSNSAAPSIASGSTGTYDLGTTGASVSFTAGSTASGSLNAAKNTGNPGGYLPGGVLSLSTDRWWQITNTGLTGFTYSISLDLTGMPNISNFNTLKVLKRNNAGSSWVDVSTLGGVSIVYHAPLITVTGLTSFSDFAIGSPDAALPVTLASFKAQSRQDHIQLDWESVNEQNLAGFEVQRTTKTNPIETDWKNIGYVASKGQSSDLNSYQFEDAEWLSGNVFYRLKSIDLNGGVHFSPVMAIQLEAPDAFALMGNYPNPFNPQTTIPYAVPTESRVQIAVYDLNGRLIRTLVDGMHQPGRYTVNFQAEGLSSGTYLYTMRAANFSQSKTFVVIK